MLGHRVWICYYCNSKENQSLNDLGPCKCGDFRYELQYEHTPQDMLQENLFAFTDPEGIFLVEL